jgi:hypothetical protein
VVAARREADAIGRPDLRIGFSVMWRWSPDSDAKFWQRIGELADANPAFRPSLDHVGLQIYPGLVWPPAPLPDRTAGQEMVEALTLMRSCYLPKAKLGREVDLWVTENGYATNAGRTEAAQVTSLTDTLRDLHRWSGELGVTDHRWFNLRDNDSDGADLFAAVGLLRDDYSRKPAFPVYRDLVRELGARPGAEQRPAPSSPPPRACTSRRRFTIAVKLRRARVTLAGRRVPVRRGVAVVDLRGRPAETVRVRIRGVDRRGRTVTRTRAFRTCTPR